MKTRPTILFFPFTEISSLPDSLIGKFTMYVCRLVNLDDVTPPPLFPNPEVFATSLRTGRERLKIKNEKMSNGLSLLVFHGIGTIQFLSINIFTSYSRFYLYGVYTIDAYSVPFFRGNSMPDQYCVCFVIIRSIVVDA